MKGCQANFHPKPVLNQFEITWKISRNYVLRHAEDDVVLDSVIRFCIREFVGSFLVRFNNRVGDESITS